jgi:hypothetical protein
MTLQEWVKGQSRGALSRLSRETGLAYTTVFGIARGKQRARYESAKLISAATEGAVSISEMCDAPAVASDPSAKSA